MKKNETIADIVAEMRRDASDICEHGTRCLGNYADRIEAAHKETMRKLDEARQTAEDSLWDKAERDDQAAVVKQNFTTGNATKLRKALKESADFARDHIHIDDFHLNEECYCLGCCEARAMVEMCESALTAPPRNCDTLESYDEFVDAWNAYVRRTHGGVEGFLAWLSAEAKGEKK